ncbi:hypothetical protein GPECTOR_6g775 [Gonium pectorale]|uniref:Protein kinase domain-containing protein n=1 Tax=Gonium pectorale TaxID=33097 RepID=A0A150GVF0_GONPE|nr:hypothetical protein GPECTOR_6g775 [Gonium pectorale]|eukprot:KXZ53857.1 hypothetical protein GPECTOR_6g775 [Gonium pectorale]
MSQITFLQMLQMGGGAAMGLPGAAASLLVPPAFPAYAPPIATLNLAALSREITALRWLGQGGGGAVFQGVWQGAPVAVKFLLTSADGPAAAHAAALEGVVSSVVNHPNVVHTYAFECTLLTEASFAGDLECERQSSSLDGLGTRDLFESLMDTTAMNGPGSPAAAAARRNSLLQAGAPVASSVGPSRLGHQPFSLGALKETALEGTGETEAEDPDERARSAGEAAASLRLSGSDHSSSQDDGRLRRADSQPTGTSVSVAPAVEPPSQLAQASQPPQQQQEQQQQPVGVLAGGPIGSQQPAMGAFGEGAGLNSSMPRTPPAALESTFQSEEGFGDPDIAGSRRGWTVRQALLYLRARPGMYMTHIIMEYCDRGSLLAAIKRGIFRMDAAHDEQGTAASSGSSSGPVPAAAAAALPAVMPSTASSAARFPRRIVLRAVLRTARDIAQGMCHLHANGIIHGDLKPGNVLLRGCRTDRRGFVAMVADFGLSKIAHGDKPLEAHHWSTVTVMAPEVIMGRWLKASDVFSFGILLWQLVTSEPIPYGKLTVPQILLGVSQGTLKPEWPPSAHPALVRLGRACLATSPEDRPSASAIVKVLTKIEKHVREELRVKKTQASGGARVRTPLPGSGYSEGASAQGPGAGVGVAAAAAAAAATGASAAFAAHGGGPALSSRRSA